MNLEAYAQQFTFDQILQKYRQRCIEAKKPYLPREKKLLFTLVFFLLLFVSLEFISNWYLKSVFQEQNPFNWPKEFGETSLANQKISFDGINYSFNAHQFRGSNRTPTEKPKLLCIGDSITLGFGVEETVTFPVLLNQKRPEIEVINGGVIGLKVSDWSDYSEKVLPLHPNWVLCCLGGEDLIQLSKKIDWNQIPAHSILHHSAFLTLLKYWKVKRQREKQIFEEWGKRKNKKFHEGLVFKKLKDDLISMVRFYQQQEIQVILCEVPDFFPNTDTNTAKKVNPLQHYSDWSLENWKILSNLLNQTIAEVAKAERIPLIEIRSKMANSEYFRDFRHPNKKGYNVMAEQINFVLKKKNCLKKE